MILYMSMYCLATHAQYDIGDLNKLWDTTMVQLKLVKNIAWKEGLAGARWGATREGRGGVIGWLAERIRAC